MPSHDRDEMPIADAKGVAPFFFLSEIQTLITNFVDSAVGNQKHDSTVLIFTKGVDVTLRLMVGQAGVELNFKCKNDSPAVPFMSKKNVRPAAIFGASLRSHV